MSSSASARGLRRAAIAGVLSVTLLTASTPLKLHAEKKHLKSYALIFGTVWDAQNHAAPGVKIRIRREGEKKPKWELISDHQGEFAQRVPAEKADYLVWAEIKGKKGPAAQTKVHIESDERQDIGLHLPE